MSVNSSAQLSAIGMGTLRSQYGWWWRHNARPSCEGRGGRHQGGPSSPLIVLYLHSAGTGKDQVTETYGRPGVFNPLTLRTSIGASKVLLRSDP